jgi:hypothetical protein
MDFAAEYGHLDVLIYLDQMGKSFTGYAFDAAGINGIPMLISSD